MYKIIKYDKYYGTNNVLIIFYNTCFTNLHFSFFIIICTDFVPNYIKKKKSDTFVCF